MQALWQVCCTGSPKKQTHHAGRVCGCYHPLSCLSGLPVLTQCSANSLFLVFIPVSYTHLDVYKRQLIETIRALRGVEGVAGVHLMGHRNEATLAEAIRRSGVREGIETSAVQRA